MKQETYTIDDLVTMSCLTRRTIQNHLKNGLLEGRKFGGAWRFTKAQVDAWMDDSEVTTGIRSAMDEREDELRATEPCVVIVNEALPEARLAAIIAKVNSLEDVRMQYHRDSAGTRLVLASTVAKIRALMETLDA